MSPRLLALACLAMAGCLVCVITEPGAPLGDAGPVQPVSLPDGGTGYLLPDGGIAPTLVEAICHANPLSGPVGTLITFDGQDSQGSPGATVVAWSWSFGDGADGGGAVTSHAYPDGGSYTAVLTATDDSGASGSAPCPTATLGP